MFQSLGVSRGGNGNRVGAEQGNFLPRFMLSKVLRPYVSEEIRLALNSPILFTGTGFGRTAYGYPALILVDICEMILQARDDEVLGQRHSNLVARCDTLIRGLARVGIIALVDEATGYQEIREQRALAKVLEKYLAEELQPWTKTFPYEFYEQIFRLKGWSGPQGYKRPSVIGHYTNEIVYARLAPGVLEELRKRNPVRRNGDRLNKHHQWFNPEFGHPKLREHLIAVIALMRAATSWATFKMGLQRAFQE